MAGWIRRLPPQMKGPAMARALTTPSTIVATGAAAAAGIALGLPALAVGGIAAIAYAVKAALTVARPTELAKVVFPDIGIDLSRLDPESLRQMQDALMARQAYRAALKEVAPGPFRDRFSDMGTQVDDAVEGLYKLVVRAQTLRRYLFRTPLRPKTDELARVQANLRAQHPGPGRDLYAAQAEALEEQLAARQRIQAAHDGAVAKVGATTARLEQLSAQLTEISLMSDDDAAVAALPGAKSDVASLVDELDSVRLALDEMATPPGVDLPAAPDPARGSREKQAGEAAG